MALGKPRFDARLTDVPRLPVFFIFPLWCGGLVVGQAWNWKAGL